MKAHPPAVRAICRKVRSIPDIEQPLPGRNVIYLADFVPKELKDLASEGGEPLNDYCDVP